MRAGQTLGLVGESGCGKTTTGRLLTRLLEPTSGQILLDGHDITHLPAGKMRPLRRDVQMIFQDPYSSLNPRHTVGTIVGAPLRLQKIRTDAGIKRTVQGLLERVGLNPEHYNRYPHEFSGGQRQRIGIARTPQRIRLAGDVPSPLSPPPACRFHTRCWKAEDICRTLEPALAELAPGHRLACHFPENTPAVQDPAGHAE